MKRSEFVSQRFANLILAFFIVTPTPTWAADILASNWVEGTNNKARLLAGRAARDSVAGLYAGIEIAMPPGWKTYWRTPGESGVPPEFDWGNSHNLASAEVLYPAPHRLHDKGGDSIGYKDDVTFPVLLIPKDPAQPVDIHVKVIFGVCKDICIPAEADIELRVPVDAGASETLAKALDNVPRRAASSGSDPSLASWQLDTATTGKPKLVLKIATQSPESIDVFLEASGGTYVPLPKRTAGNNDKAVFEADLTDGVNLKDLLGKPMTVTMSDERGQSETTITLESAKPGATVPK